MRFEQRKEGIERTRGGSLEMLILINIFFLDVFSGVNRPQCVQSTQNRGGLPPNAVSFADLAKDESTNGIDKQVHT